MNPSNIPGAHDTMDRIDCGSAGSYDPAKEGDPTGPGYIHAYCRTDEEKRVERRERAEAQRKAAEKWKPPAKHPTDPRPADMNDPNWPFAPGVDLPVGGGNGR